MMNTNMQSVAGDRFRLAPLLLFANSLLLRSEYKRHLNAICIDVIMLEAITQRNGEWGRYVLCVEREFVTAIRAMFFEICHEDSIEGFLVDLHMIIRTFVNGAPSSSRTIDYMWQKAAVPAHAFYEVCCIEDEESFLRALSEFAEPSEQAKEIAASTESSGSVITIAGVVQGQFPLWDSETFPSWYYSLDSPYMQRYSNGYCYKRLSTSIIRHDYGKWPKISDVRRSQYNPYMRCSFVGGKKWHVPSPTSAWVPALRCAKDLESSACVGGDAHVVLDVAATLSPPPSIAEVGGMSVTIAKLYNLSLEGFSAVTVSPSPWSESVAPYTPYLFGFPFHRRGYLIYPVGFAPIASRVSANVAFVKRPVAAYASVSGKWYSLDVSEPRLSFSCTSSELVLVMVLFPGVSDYGDVADFLAADVQRGILSKL